MIVDRDDNIADERLEYGVACAQSMSHVDAGDAGTRGMTSLAAAGYWIAPTGHVIPRVRPT
jgi:hypothetical protein